MRWVWELHSFLRSSKLKITFVARRADAHIVSTGRLFAGKAFICGGLLVQVFGLGLLLVCISPGGLLARSMHNSHDRAVDVTAFVAPDFQGDQDLLIGPRVSSEDETEGLDLTQHGEEGYHWGTST